MSSFEDDLYMDLPDSPKFDYQDDLEIEGGVRNLSVSSDGTIESLISQGEPAVALRSF